MSRFIPLPFTTYAWQRHSPQQVATPPYDVYDQKVKQHLQAKSDYNFSYLDKPENYEQAKELLCRWLDQKNLITLPKASFFLMQTKYHLENKTFTRIGLLGGLKLTPLQQDYVFAHEKTYPKAKQDRLNLMQKTSSQLSPIFAVYNDKTFFLEQIKSKITQKDPWITYPEKLDLVHTLWEVPPELEPEIINFFSDQVFFIADGHHRYETALNYKNQQNKKGPWDYVFTYVSNAASPDVIILPYHRMLTWAKEFDFDQIITKAKNYFEIQPLPKQEQSLVANYDFLLWTKEKALGFKFKTKPTDVFYHISTFLLDEFVLKQHLSEEELKTGKYILYSPFAQEIQSKLQTGEVQAGFIVKEVSKDVFQEVCLNKRLMPRKSTYFYPKVPSGLLFYSWI